MDPGRGIRESMHSAIIRPSARAARGCRAGNFQPGLPAARTDMALSRPIRTGKKEMAMSFDAEVRVPLNALVGEGPIWDDQKSVLWWIDIISSRLYAFDPRTGDNRAWDTGQHVGTIVPWKDDTVMLALQHGFGTFHLDTGTVTILNDPESNQPANRFNDGKCDPAGRFWAGTMAYEDQRDQGSLYRMDTDQDVTRILGGIGISNGIVWSLDHSIMYYIDSMSYRIRAWDFDLASGNIANARDILRVAPDFGLPDGMTIDEEGMLWTAFYGGGRVCRIHPVSGEVLATIELPVPAITACAFGDQALDTLYITSAAQGMTAEEIEAAPQSGNLFSVKTGIRGVPAFRFGG